MLNALTKSQLMRTLERVDKGSLFLSLPDGSDHFIDSGNPGPHADLSVSDWSVIRNVARNGDVGFADSYRAGSWETSNLMEFFMFALANKETLGSYASGTLLSKLRAQIGYLFRINSLQGSKRNIQQHYDLGNDFYSIWLDPTMTYSSALYNNADADLSAAQLNKYDRLIDRIDATSGSILEIGCGWGGFAERAMERTRCNLKGLTLSNEQLSYANNRLGGEADFALQDYRKERGIYDTIVSIEMFEAVGMQYWKQYFDKVKACLRKSGKALIQTITIDNEVFDSYKYGSDMIRSYIFPGGMLPSDHQFTGKAESSGLKVTDRFEFGTDYSRTLLHWLRNFEGALPEIKELGFDDGFTRIWRYYLASCAAGFKHGQIQVMQYELTHA